VDEWGDGQQLGFKRTIHVPWFSDSENHLVYSGVPFVARRQNLLAAGFILEKFQKTSCQAPRHLLYANSNTFALWGFAVEFRKEIIRPATYTYINPATGTPERMTVTPETVKHFHDQGNAMIAAGLSIPLPLEHQPTAKPMTASEKAAANLKNNAGDTKRYEIGKADDGQDALFAVVDVADPGIAEKIKNRSIKWVSPWINSFVDGAGKAWNNVISHIALTATPRITKQQPFASIDAAMSLVGSLSEKVLAPSAKLQDGGFSLMRAGRLKKDGDKLKPMFPAAFSLMTGVKLSKDEFEEIEGTEDEDSEDGDSEGEEGEPESVAATDGLEGEMPSKDIAIHDLLADLLGIMDIKLPSGTNAANFLMGLYEALMGKVREMGGKVDGQGEELGTLGDKPEMDQKKAQSPVIQESPPMYMSIQEIHEKVTDPAQRKLHEICLSLHTENQQNKAKADAATKHILDDAKSKRQAIVEGIAKKLPAAKRDKLLQQAASVQLSLTADGKIIDPMAEVIQLNAELANALDTRLSSTTIVQQHPKDGITYDPAKLEEYMRATGGSPVNAKSV